MADIIQLLPDSIANQIAAGEVIQRPASVVKELMENSIDAEATEVKLVVRDAGKHIVQVIDNGKGMTETDARMCFERHATSKIRKANDLFSINTMGFRGEAMASIASVAQVSLKTCPKDTEIGTQIVIEGSKIKDHSPCHTQQGTVITVSNLFYNVPARKKFLKSNTVEMKHIIEEFQRLALAHPDVFFSLHADDSEIYHLPPANLRQRIVGVLGSKTNEKLVPVTEQTDAVEFEGYVGKPEFAKRNRGEQYFFVNNRYIKSNYLNHAIGAAFEGMIAKDTHPLYVIFITIDPNKIDVNVHPTKQEIKFDNERVVYNYLKVAVRHGLGQHGVNPTLDFEQEQLFNNYTPPSETNHSSASNQTSFSTTGSSFNDSQNTSQSKRNIDNFNNWEKLYEGLEDLSSVQQPKTQDESEKLLDFNDDAIEQIPAEKISSAPSKLNSNWADNCTQIHNRYIIHNIEKGFLLIDQQYAHERVLYEEYYKMLNDEKSPIQKELFPQTLNLSAGDALLMNEILPQIRNLGFDIEFIGQHSFIVNGLPADLKADHDISVLLSEMLNSYKEGRDLKLDTKECIARSLSRSAGIKRGRKLNAQEMAHLVKRLLACKIPSKSPFGQSTFVQFSLDDLHQLFSK